MNTRTGYERVQADEAPCSQCVGDCGCEPGRAWGRAVECPWCGRLTICHFPSGEKLPPATCVAHYEEHIQKQQYRR